MMKKKAKINNWFMKEVMKKFRFNIIEIDKAIALKWGDIDALFEMQGKKLPIVDGLLASSSIIHKMTLVTRNISDFKRTECFLLNPWDN